MPLTQSAEPLSQAEFAALLAPFDPLPDLAVGCSGGPDSLALALLAADWAGARGGRALALVCDHGLRPESGAEADGVAARLAARGVQARVLRLSLAPGPRLQERARAARLAALLAACRGEGVTQLLLAHHAEDQAETALFRALRGSGPLGLAGMPAAAPAADALVLRPLLGVARARLAATCAARGAEPVRDPSNDDPRFARARLRRGGAALGALPAQGALAARRARLEAEAAALLARGGARLLPEGCARLDPEALGRGAAGLLAFRRLLRAVGGGAFAPAEDAARDLLARGAGTLGGAVLLRGGRWLCREGAGLAPPVPAGRGARWDRRFRLRGAVPPGLTLGALGPGRLRDRAPHLPAAAVAALPALYEGGELALVPHLRWPSPEACAGLALDFAPDGGPSFAGELRVMPVSARDMAPYLPTEPGSPRHEDRET